MLKITTLFLFLITNFAFCQSKTNFAFETDTGKYVFDTTDVMPCMKRYLMESFNLHIKYPENSETLLEKVQKSYKKPKNFYENGFLTIRFMVNCEGKIGQYHLYQVDENYKKVTFPKTIQEQLLAFVKSLKDWQIGVYKSNEVNYMAYFTFKIKNGEIENIIP